MFRSFAPLVKMFLRDAHRQRHRLILTVFALCWGTISIMLLLGFGEGMYQSLLGSQKGMGEGILVVWGGGTTKPYKGLGKGRQIMFIPEDVEILRANIPEIRNVGGEYHRWGVSTKFGDQVRTSHVNGIPSFFEEARVHYPQSGGRMINEKDIELKRRVAFLGDGIAKELFGDVDPVGKEMLLQSIPFTVVGVMQHKRQSNSYSGSDEEKISIPLTTFVAIFGDPYLDNLIVEPNSLDNIDYVKERMKIVMAGVHKFDPTDEQALWIWDVAEGQKEFSSVMRGMQIFLGIIGGLTLVIASVGVANIMYVSVRERTREIGVKMAVGARKSVILMQFFLEALLLTFSGGLLGMVCSFALIKGFTALDIKNDAMEFLGNPIITVEIGLIVVVILGTLGTIAGFFPALKAASISPVQALRYE